MIRRVDQIAQNRTRSGAGPSDAALVVAARSGEQWACEALFRRYAKMVNALAFRLEPWADRADDLVQDSFVQALDSLNRLKEPAAFAAWLRSIVIRTASKRIRRHRLLTKLGLARYTPIDLDSLIAPGAPADVIVELHRIYERIHTLPAECRVALILKRVEGLALEEIAQKMGVSQGTVKRRLKSAGRLLEKQIRRGEDQ